MPAPLDLAQKLVSQFNTSGWIFNKTLEGITHEDSLAKPAPAGSCLNWVAWHITNSRLDEPAPFSPGNDEDETIGSLLAPLSFH
ncbi:MAG: hypothetical protein ABIF77_19350 [bacterium]